MRAWAWRPLFAGLWHAALLRALGESGDVASLVQGSLRAHGLAQTPRPPTFQVSTAVTDTALGPRVDTELGPILGKRVESVTPGGYIVFRGIPYAEPPERFAVPKPKIPWGPDVLEAKAFRPSCVGSGVKDLEESEDCLFLNVWLPPGGLQGLPVIVYLHGGMNQHGSGHEPLRHGDLMVQSAQYPVIFINFDFRLGIFGWIDLEDPAMPKNLGLRDQQMAMRWVSRHVAAFGGDPGRVSLMGHSEGAGAVLAHMVSEGSFGLFQRATLHSPPADFFSRRTNRVRTASMLARLKCKRDETEDIVGCLQRRAPEKIWDADWVVESLARDAGSAKWFHELVDVMKFLNGADLKTLPGYLGWHPVVDNVTLLGEPRELIEEGRYQRVQVLITSSRNESLGSFSAGNGDEFSRSPSPPPPRPTAPEPRPAAAGGPQRPGGEGMTGETGAGGLGVAELPQGCEAQYAALMKLPAPEVKKMLREISLPSAGSKAQQVLRLVRELAGLPPTAADEELLAAEAGKKGGRGKRGRAKAEAAAQEEAPAPAAEGDQDVAAVMREVEEQAKLREAEERERLRQERAALAEERERQRLEREKQAAAQAERERQRLEREAQKAAELEKAQAREAEERAKRRKEKKEQKEHKKHKMDESAELAEKNKKAKLEEEQAMAEKQKAQEDAAKVQKESEDSSDEDSDEEEDPMMQGEGERGAAVLGLDKGTGDLLLADEGKWLWCIQEVLDADIEVSLDVKGSKREEPKGAQPDEAPVGELLAGPPPRLRLRSPGGQGECEGVYELLPEETVNGQPLWKHEDASRWLYSGTDGTWLVGGSKQKSLNFACRTGYLHLRVPHEGRPPQTVQGVWRRVDGKQWREDPDVQVSVYVPEPDPRRPGLPVRVDNLRKQPRRRLNGAFGRLLSLDGEGEDAAWRVRLAAGLDERLPAANVEPRAPQSEHGEAWVRPRAPQGAEEAALGKVLGAVVRLAREAAAPDAEGAEGQIGEVPEVLAASCSQIRVPEAAYEAVAVTVAEVEVELQVACFWKYQEEDDPDEDLVPGATATALFEGSRCGCKLKEVHAPTKQATITWDYDGSESQAPLSEIKLKVDKASKERRQRRKWLRGAWILVILGGAKQRQVAALRVLASVEDVCPGLWTTDLNDAVAEVRRSPAAEPSAATPIGVEARPLTGGDAEPWLAGAADAGRLSLPALRRASLASGCGIELLLPAGLFIVGSKSERSHVLDYLRWLLAEGSPDAASGSSERALRGDVAVIRTQRGRTAWLKPNVLKGIERETTTLIFLDHGDKDKADWDPNGAAQVHVCGSNPELRSRAASQLEVLLQAMGPEGENQDILEMTPKRRKLSEAVQLERQLQEERQRREDLEKKLQEAEEERKRLAEKKPANPAAAKAEDAAKDPEPEEDEFRPSDPLSELRKLKSWPKDNQTWLSLQDTVWANHPKLARGWIRVWSRSKDMEYYVRLTDGKASFNFADAKAE